MTNDITTIHYTANLIEETFAANIRKHLMSWLPEGTPIISVSHKPMDFGKNICVEGFAYSIYNIYRQILIGAEATDTPYIMCHEDDALYNLEHFSFRPPKDTFAYNLNRWVIDNDIFFHRNRANMSMCIASRDLMVETLKIRFKNYPTELVDRADLVGFGEPGRSELKLDLPHVKMMTFETKHPTIVFNHRPSVGGVRKILRNDVIKKEIPKWGKAIDLWKNIYGC